MRGRKPNAHAQRRRDRAIAIQPEAPIAKTDPERVTIIGLGRFGSSVAKTLFDQGYEVTAIDIHEHIVAEASDFVTLAAQGDGTDEELLRSLAVDRSHFGIVAQGENLEASALSTLVLKRLKVPWVVARATNDLHGELLRRVGANLVIFPERDAGVRLGHSLSVHAAIDYIPLSSPSGIAKRHRQAASPNGIAKRHRQTASPSGIAKRHRQAASPHPTSWTIACKSSAPGTNHWKCC